VLKEESTAHLQDDLSCYVSKIVIYMTNNKNYL